jgi:uncharacterized protein (TIGR03086 family)
VDVLDQLSATFAMAADVVDGIAPDQLELPTPCADWNVGRLLGHTIGVLDAFAVREPNPAAVAPLDADVSAQFAASAAAALAAWGTPGALDGSVARPGRPALPWSVFAGINVVDTFAHAWDLAQATGQSAKIDEDLAAHCLDTARQVVPDAARAIVGFAPEQVVGPTRPPSDQLAGFLGRALPA